MRALILVVDDDLAIRQMMREFLVAKGCAVLEAGDGASGLALAEKELPALIVMDVMMPSMYGTSAVKRLQDMSETARIPVLVYSAADEAAVRRLVPQAPGVRFLRKPSPLPEIWREIEALLRGP